jgi:predicted SAM-dependent methyltransferase
MTPVATVPGVLRRSGLTVPTQRVARRVAHRPLMAFRRRYYADGSGAALVDRLPDAIREGLGLDDESARLTRRIEIGAGPYPRPGYVHVDADPNARHLEAEALAWDLPFPDGWANEISSVHVLEHVHPRRLQTTLREWHRVLRPGGVVRVHVPNSPALMQAWLAAEGTREKWMLAGAVLGMYGGPHVRGPEDLPTDADHQILFDRELLLASLGEAGFVDVADLTETVTDRHTEGWKEVVDRCSIVAEGRKATAPSSTG